MAKMQEWVRADGHTRYRVSGLRSAIASRSAAAANEDFIRQSIE